VKNPTMQLRTWSETDTTATCPPGRHRHVSEAPDACSGDPSADVQFMQARRQGVYLAACIVDEVAALQVGSAQAAVDEIRRRISKLVRQEFDNVAGGHRD
jgi:hypothetical protein